MANDSKELERLVSKGEMLSEKKTVSRPEKLRKKGQQINRVRIQFTSVRKSGERRKKSER